MRLGQLARVIALKPKELISFLEEKGISSYTHANSKLSQEDESFILGHFGKTAEIHVEEVAVKEPAITPLTEPSLT